MQFPFIEFPRCVHLVVNFPASTTWIGDCRWGPTMQVRVRHTFIDVVPTCVREQRRHSEPPCAQDNVSTQWRALVLNWMLSRKLSRCNADVLRQAYDTVTSLSEFMNRNNVPYDVQLTHSVLLRVLPTASRKTCLCILPSKQIGACIDMVQGFRTGTGLEQCSKQYCRACHNPACVCFYLLQRRKRKGRGARQRHDWR